MEKNFFNNCFCISKVNFCIVTNITHNRSPNEQIFITYLRSKNFKTLPGSSLSNMNKLIREANYVAHALSSVDGSLGSINLETFLHAIMLRRLKRWELFVSASTNRLQVAVRSKKKLWNSLDSTRRDKSEKRYKSFTTIHFLGGFSFFILFSLHI